MVKDFRRRRPARLVRLCRASIVALSAALLPASSLAQQPPQQTPEGAQQFLAELARRGGLRMFWGKDDAGNATYRTTVRQVISDVRSSNPCVSELVMGQVIRQNGVVQVDTQPITINWSRVNEVRQQENADFIAITPRWSSWESIGFNAGSTDFASRLAYAMEFLRVSCDVTSRTGF